MLTTRPPTGNISNVLPVAAGNAYTYDYVGNRKDMTVTDGSGTRVHVYSYDDILTEVKKPTPPTQDLDNLSAYTQGGDAPWVQDYSGFAQSGDIDDDQQSWMYIDVSGPGTVRFKWKTSSQQWCDYLEFWVDNEAQPRLLDQRRVGLAG